MSEADEMFGKIGYKSEKYNRCFGAIASYIKDDKSIEFYNDKTFAVFNIIDNYEYIDIQELKAINKKCEELGWI